MNQPVIKLLPTTVVTGLCRVQYANELWTPKVNANTWEQRSADGQIDATPKYSCQVIIPKTDTTTLQAISKAIAAARTKGVEKGLWSRERAPNVKSGVRDGDLEIEQGVKSERCLVGHFFLNASSYSKPNLVGPNPRNPLKREDIYSGMFGCFELNFYPANVKGNACIAAGLNGFQKVKDGERLDGRNDPASVFANYESTDGPEDYVGGDGGVSF